MIYLRSILLIAFIPVVAFVVYVYHLLDICDVSVYQKILSPQGDRVAYVFSRDCGATTPINTQISILDSSDKPDSGNVLIVEGENSHYRVFWESNNEVTILSSAKETEYLKKESIELDETIQINYRQCINKKY